MYVLIPFAGMVMNNIILLSNNDNSKSLYTWLLSKGYSVTLLSDPVTVDTVTALSPDLVISYNYRHIIKEDVIDLLGNKIINLHTSYLPWNKGSSPNIWSFIDDTPKGVTIHRLEKGLDTGKIIVQKECTFNEDTDTLASSYDKLNSEIVALLKDNLDIIMAGEYQLKDQEGKGTYHRTSDLKALLGGRTIDYSMTIRQFREFITHA